MLAGVRNLRGSFLAVLAKLSPLLGHEVSFKGHEAPRVRTRKAGDAQPSKASKASLAPDASPTNQALEWILVIGISSSAQRAPEELAAVLLR